MCKALFSEIIGELVALPGYANTYMNEQYSFAFQNKKGTKQWNYYSQCRVKPVRLFSYFKRDLNT